MKMLMVSRPLRGTTTQPQRAPRPGASSDQRQQTGEVRFMTLDPGHFHAALVQKEMYGGVSPKVYVYAPLGQDLIDHLGRIANYNNRQGNPTHWEMVIKTGPDFLQQMLQEH